jgi:hypothetical protein
MSPIDKYPKKDTFVTVKSDFGTIKVLNPQYLKEDQYKNMSSNLFSDSHRIKKSIKKIKLLEKYFPLSEQKMIVYDYKYLTYEKDLPKDLKDYIFGGDYVFNIYFPDTPIEENEIILYTNDCESGEYYPNIRVLPWDGATLYMWVDVPKDSNYVISKRDPNHRDKIKIISKFGLLHTYYKLFSETKNSKYKTAIELLVQKSDEFDVYSIGSPDILEEKKFTIPMKTIWMQNGKFL